MYTYPFNCEFWEGKSSSYLFLNPQEVTYARASQHMMLMVKNPPANAGDQRDAGSIPGWERAPGEGNGNPLRYSCLENPMEEELAVLRSIGSQGFGHTQSDFAHRHI